MLAGYDTGVCQVNVLWINMVTVFVTEHHVFVQLMCKCVCVCSVIVVAQCNSRLRNGDFTSFLKKKNSPVYAVVSVV